MRYCSKQLVVVICYTSRFERGIFHNVYFDKATYDLTDHTIAFASWGIDNDYLCSTRSMAETKPYAPDSCALDSYLNRTYPV